MGPKRPRVLIVHPDAAFRMRRARHLSLSGACVDTAPNAAGALRLLRSQGYDLVVTDALLPDANGLQVWEEGRRLSEARFILTVDTPPTEDLRATVRAHGVELVDLGAADPDETLARAL